MIIFAVIVYFTIISYFILSSYSRRLTSSDFIIGGRSLSPFTTALAAHASDMSNWLFMAYPALVFTAGLFSCWIALGLILCMYFNWQLVAPRIRRFTESSRSLTFSSFFEWRFQDSTGMLRLFTAVISMVFYTIYIAAGLVGMGLLLNSIFGLSYSLSILISILIIIPYVLVGGFKTLARIDLFQGLFLLLVISIVPCYIYFQVGGWPMIFKEAALANIPLKLFPELSIKSMLEVVFLVFSWGLGYFGQPAIVTKFMGIKNSSEIYISKRIGMVWLCLSFSAATLVGLVGIAFFKGQIENPEMIFIEMVKSSFHPFLIGLFLCGVFAATINVMSAQMLVIASNVAEDFYKKFFKKEASSAELVRISRLGVVAVALVAYVIAALKISSIYSLVHYAWAGLGASFGPLLLWSLYSKKTCKEGAWAGVLVGGITSVVWPAIAGYFPFKIDAMFPGFFLSLLAIMAITSIRGKYRLRASIEGIFQEEKR